MDPTDLLDLAADLGCISAEEQSFTFKPSSTSNNEPTDKTTSGKQ